MAQHRVFGVQVLSRWGRGPDLIGRVLSLAVLVGERGEVIECLVRGTGGRGVCDVCPGTTHRDAGREWDVAILAVPAYG